MGFSTITVKAIIILYNKCPDFDLIERLEAEVFYTDDGYELMSSACALTDMMINYSYNKPMFDLLSSYTLDKLKNHRSFYHSRWAVLFNPIDTEADHLKDDYVTEFLIRVYLYEGIIVSDKLKYFSDEYRMFVEL